MIELRHPAGYRTAWKTAPDDPVEDWRREHAFMESQRERPVVGAKLWRGIRFAMLPSLILWFCLTALFSWALFG